MYPNTTVGEISSAILIGSLPKYCYCCHYKILEVRFIKKTELSDCG